MFFELGKTDVDRQSHYTPNSPADGHLSNGVIVFAFFFIYESLISSLAQLFS